MGGSDQKALLIDPGAPARVWCVDCGTELTDEVSRMRRKGPECDPDPRTRPRRHEVDQDSIPGL